MPSMTTQYVCVCVVCVYARRVRKWCVRVFDMCVMMCNDVLSLKVLEPLLLRIGGGHLI